MAVGAGGGLSAPAKRAHACLPSVGNTRLRRATWVSNALTGIARSSKEPEGSGGRPHRQPTLHVNVVPCDPLGPGLAFLVFPGSQNECITLGSAREAGWPGSNFTNTRNGIKTEIPLEAEISLQWRAVEDVVERLNVGGGGVLFNSVGSSGFIRDAGSKREHVFFHVDPKGPQAYLSWQIKLKHNFIREKYMQMFN